jgi:DNA-binding NarL/FixJ family response regulator
MNLSPRQTEIALLVADRYSDQEIAQRLGCSTNTVKRHLDYIGDRLSAAGYRMPRRRAIHEWAKQRSTEAV